MNTSLRALGADVLSIPTFSVTSVPSPEFEDVLRRTSKRASEVLLVFTSVNAVRSFVDLCAGAGVDVADFARACVASVGPTTADAAALEGLDSDIIPSVHTAAALAGAIERAGLPVDRTTLLYPRARDASDEIESRLGPLFASMESHVVYGTAVEAPAAPFHAPPDVVLFASSSACSYFEHVVTPTMVSVVK
ncbi:MAG: uroporphyrinogen-III synthase, partial [Candidatus Krumholzibacteriota bacterium]|nr:uroporphyrinogen-III synthase [Candidatus Krumholzibacteriota bacterium]